VKIAVLLALREGVNRAGLPCTIYTDGMTVVVDRQHSREPDAAVQCGDQPDPDALILDAPLIVVEVVSPSTERDDTGAKLIEYFSVVSVPLYQIVNPEKRVVVHHRRDGNEIRTRIVGADGGDRASIRPASAFPRRRSSMNADEARAGASRVAASCRARRR